CDAILIVVGEYIACRLYPEAWDTEKTLAATLAVIAFYLIGEMNGLYRSWRGQPFRNEAFQVLSTWFVTIPVLLCLAFMAKVSAEYSRIITLTWFLVAPALMLLWRLSFRAVLRSSACGGGTRGPS